MGGSISDDVGLPGSRRYKVLVSQHSEAESGGSLNLGARNTGKNSVRSSSRCVVSDQLILCLEIHCKEAPACTVFSPLPSPQRWANLGHGSSPRVAEWDSASRRRVLFGLLWSLR